MPAVLLVTQDLERAGAQRQCAELALGLRARAGWTVDVATLEAKGPLGAELQAAGIPLHAFPRRWRWDLSPVARIAALSRAGGHDIVHSFLFLPNFYVRLARLLHRPPAVISSLRSTGIEGIPRYVAEVLLAPLCDRIIANSDSGRAILRARGVSGRRIVVVRNGLDLTRFLALPGRRDSVAFESPTVGMVARMEYERDHVGLVEAFRRVVDEHPRARLVLAGDGSFRPRIESRIRDLRLEGHVEMPGAVALPETVYGRLDLYVQASTIHEGTSNSIVEAMASGLPVVATDVGGNSEVVQDGRTGLVVAPDDAAALARAITALLKDPSRRHAMAAEGRARAAALYARDRMIDETIGAYAQILRERRGTLREPS